MGVNRRLNGLHKTGRRQFRNIGNVAVGEAPAQFQHRPAPCQKEIPPLGLRPSAPHP